jgi:S1-C subfamily serine protease
MQRAGRVFSTPFGSAVVGGLVVAIAGLILLEAGVIGEDDDSSPTLAPAPLARPASDSSGKGATVNQIYDRYAKGVAFVQAEVTRTAQSPFDLFPGEQRSTASGSGFLIDDDGHLITNAHVVEGAEGVEVQLGDDEEGQSAEVVGTDPSSDIALLKIEDTKGATPLPFGDSSEADVGDPVVAIGNPFGLDRTVTTGIVSALQRQIQAPNGFSISDVIQTDAAINPGNSGGPLLDASGQVIGINSQIASQTGGSQGVGFAVPIATAEDVVSQLREGGAVKRAYLGVTGGDISSEIAGALDLPVEQGVLVEQVFQGGPADSAGIKGATGQATIGGQTFPVDGDIITKVDGKEVAGMEDVIAAVDRRDPGDGLSLTVLSEDEEREVTVKLGERPANVRDASATPSLP